ncbi:hypothetical protein OBBRIDRAFT_835410 [Obba rivulosa]|uniref:Ubiquitin 3 binding protein But2 C-terminal domain-containing protein n=1 Tax=Obba rivulosa TaxID=1052685 RepID=A0A8E2B2B0_9APHY|nr:hypothetical protein OBBRIDRAFT_835410 [Obba rivulosa]
MIASSFLVAALALPAAIASPAMRLRQEAGCGSGPTGLGDFNTAPNITLTALNTTLPNSIQNGLPLVAAFTGFSIQLSSYVLATQASAEANSVSTIVDFSLDEGNLAPIVPHQFSSDVGVASGGILSFVSGVDNLDQPEEYCGIGITVQANTDPVGGGIPEPRLALQGDESDFALCESSSGLNVVVFQPAANNSGSYDFESCFGVDVFIFEH